MLATSVGWKKVQNGSQARGGRTCVIRYAPRMGGGAGWWSGVTFDLVASCHCPRQICGVHEQATTSRKTRIIYLTCAQHQYWCLTCTSGQLDVVQYCSLTRSYVQIDLKVKRLNYLLLISSNEQVWRMKTLFNAIIKLRTLFDDIKLMFAELNNILKYTTYFNGSYSELFTKYMYRYIHIVRVCMVIVSICIFHTLTVSIARWHIIHMPVTFYDMNIAQQQQHQRRRLTKPKRYDIISCATTI